MIRDWFTRRSDGRAEPSFEDEQLPPHIRAAIIEGQIERGCQQRKAHRLAERKLSGRA